MLWILLTAVLVPSPIARSDEPQSPTAYVHNISQNHEPGTQEAPLIVHEDRRPQNEREASEDKQDRAEKISEKHWSIGTSVGLLIVGLLQVGGIAGQIFIYNRQTTLMRENLRATENAAGAALLNAQGLVGASRSRILVSDANKSLDVWAVMLRAKNYSTTPAEVLYVFQDEAVLNLREPLPSTPYYGEPNTEFLHRRWLPKGGHIDIDESTVMEAQKTVDPIVWQDLLASRKRLWLYGVVRYRDSVTSEVHETRFCYWVSPQVGPVMGGPMGYNECT